MSDIKLVDVVSTNRVVLTKGGTRSECIKSAVGLVATLMRRGIYVGITLRTEFDVRDMINKGNLVFEEGE